MDLFGSDAALDKAHCASPDREKRKSEQRIKRGECPHCRRKTHRVSRNKLLPFGTTKREPLTVEGEVANGRCLRCDPIIGGSSNARRNGVKNNRRSARPAIPDTLEVPMASGQSVSGTDLLLDDDDMTVASEITMDPFLTAAPIPGGGRRNGSSGGASRRQPHLMHSQFEPVSEETPMKDFWSRAEEVQSHIHKLEYERMERERDIVREQEDSHREMTTGRFSSWNDHDEAQQPSAASAVQRSSAQRRISEKDEEETEESAEENEDEETEEGQWEDHEHLLRHMEQEHQRFHKGGDNRDGSRHGHNAQNPGVHPQDERSHGSSCSSPGHAKQTFHPLSRNPQFEYS
eukprot:CAMPEP_0181136718 /NCGR_PEP_ID=MMETSP1071-20121207/33321_1 /TAXON_ID=35127 /ORGANISM="Thalassiosira sp., Strain NH16" /LENGTH=345 /DNA_ID=CAMNT_0023223423 /DNA_START=332 /DNA_END=1366 /DNA_ORIENTATION=-